MQSHNLRLQIKTCLKTGLPRVNLREITLLKGYNLYTTIAHCSAAQRLLTCDDGQSIPSRNEKKLLTSTT